MSTTEKLSIQDVLDEKEGNKMLQILESNTGEKPVDLTEQDDLSLFNKTKERILGVHPLYDNFGKSKLKSEALVALGLDSNFKYLLFFGVIREYKGLDILLNTLAILKTKNVKLIIAGEFYESSDPYYAIIDKHGLRDNIVLATKFIPNEEVVNYFCAADIIVQPYKNATQSGVTQIAYHFEKPMLVTNVGG